MEVTGGGREWQNFKKRRDVMYILLGILQGIRRN